MTRKRYNELIAAVRTLRRNLKEAERPPNQTEKDYGITFCGGTVGFVYSGKFYDTLCMLEEDLYKAKKWGWVK